MRAFLDSNILLYSVIVDHPRSPRSALLVNAGHFISVQCISEFASVARRKLKMDWSKINAIVADFLGLCVVIVPLTTNVAVAGLPVAERYQSATFCIAKTCTTASSSTGG